MKQLVMFNEQIKKQDAIMDRQSFLIAKGFNVVGFQEIDMDQHLLGQLKSHGMGVEQSGDKYYLVTEDTFGTKIEKEVVCVDFRVR